MKLSEIKNIIPTLSELHFQFEDGRAVPMHFHITEVGETTKHFIDCGGTVRKERLVSFQFWEANDVEHRLAPEKLLQIIQLSERKLLIEDAEVEVEYQETTIGKFDLVYDGAIFILKNKYTDCLAKDNCGVPAEKRKLNLNEVVSTAACCAPGGTCC